jgi:hypothetical protein
MRDIRPFPAFGPFARRPPRITPFAQPLRSRLPAFGERLVPHTSTADRQARSDERSQTPLEKARGRQAESRFPPAAPRPQATPSFLKGTGPGVLFEGKLSTATTSATPAKNDASRPTGLMIVFFYGPGLVAAPSGFACHSALIRPPFPPRGGWFRDRVA